MNKVAFLKKKGYKIITLKNRMGTPFKAVITKNRDCLACPYVLGNKYGDICCALTAIGNEQYGCLIDIEDA